MPVAPCSSPVAPRAGPGSRLDPPRPYPPRVLTPVLLGPAGPHGAPLVHALPRRLDPRAEGRVRDRSRLRFGRRPQPGSSADPSSRRLPSRQRPSSTGSLPDRDHAFDQRTHVSKGPHECHTRGDAPAGRGGAVQRRLIAMVRWYQQAFQWRPSPCRFTPSCSVYAVEALESHGAGRGLWLTIRRLLRCRPFGPSGFDPVPESHRHSHPVELT